MTSTRRRLSATATLLLVPMLAACGFGAQTNQQYQSATGSDSIQVKDASGHLVNGDSPVQVYNAAIVVQQGDPNGVFVGTFVNNSAPDPAQGYNASSGTLNDPGYEATVTTMAVGTAAATPVSLTLPSQGTYTPQPIGCGNNDYGLKVTVPAASVETVELAKGQYIPMTFNIQTASHSYTVTMSVPVFPVDGAGGTFAPYFSNTGAQTSDQCPVQTATPAAAAVWSAPTATGSTTQTSGATVGSSASSSPTTGATSTTKP